MHVLSARARILHLLMANVKEKTFEASLAELEQIVKRLEDGEQPLEESLRLFEGGVKLARECRERLTQAERRIEVLMKDSDGRLVLSELDTAAPAAEKKAASGKRIVFDTDDDDTPF
jgi:exodeoxyribonuclease VII small subunit